MNLRTMQYALDGLELLSQSFEKTFFIPGNHDLYYRDQRAVHSTAWAKHIPNITIVNDFMTDSNVSIVPWMIGDDHKKIKKLKSKYVFGHFELPHFFMNSKVKMPEHGEIQANDFDNVEEVYSGHFHMRQKNNNITYVGNCFPHDYSDAGDDSRGLTILEWGKEPVFHAWDEQPKYRVYNLSDVLRDTDNLLKPRMHCRINLDIDISYEEAAFIRETFVDTYRLRELTLIPVKNFDLGDDIMLGNVSFESVDTIVSNQLTSITSEHYDPKLLLQIYRNL